ncbi:MAG TPA: hypothetical protein ENH59_10505 [Bacteroidetes bacterium]|nr:hypothetical protein [Bacteroidota bacterium]
MNRFYKGMILILFISGSLLYLSSCEKKPALAEILTEDITSVTQTSAITGGFISNSGGAEITARGICWGTSINPATSGNKTSDGTGTGTFTSIINQLTPGTMYYVRAYAINEAGTSYGNQRSFTTTDILTPTLTTVEAGSITLTSAVSGGNITDDGGADISTRGVCWSTSEDPTTADNKTEDGSGTGSFTSDLTNLTPGTDYYVRAYATNSAGTAYGNQETFTTVALELATVTTASADHVTQTSAMLGGDVTDDGGSDVTAKGVCWSTSSNPTTDDNTTNDGSGTGAFTSNLSGLTPGTTYYVRAYAINSIGTAYGSEVSFDTDPVELATVATAAIDDAYVTANSAVAGGNVTDDGGGNVTAKGVCWSTSQSPTLDDDFTDEGPGTGSFTSALSGLANGTTYYVRAYATNNAGTAYGNEASFTTDEILLATLTTTGASAITSFTAASGGNVSDDGGGTVTARGVCWSTTAEPTISDNTLSSGTGTGSFICELDGLDASTTYYVRAYATNSTGTAYGSQVSFTTTESLSDIDGNVYATVQIGSQVWMAENLRTTTYNNGTSIAVITDNEQWSNLTGPACCFYNNNEPAFGDTYGALYNWYTIEADNLCPEGWHVPTADDWSVLIDYIGGNAEGGKLKETGTIHWRSPNIGATNETGFTFRPSGFRLPGGTYVNIETYGHSWISSEYDAENASFRYTAYDDDYLYWWYADMNCGKPTRCIKD